MPDERQFTSDGPSSETAASTVEDGNRTDPAGFTRPESESAAVKLPFDHLCHYEVVGWIGHGEMGDVYRGYERALDRSVALKVLATELSAEPELVRRFYAEASAAARVIHPHVIPIHFIGEDNGRHFLAMQYVDGESLATLLARRGRLSVDETLDLLEQVLSGLGAAHRQGLIHRDIKPGNILLDRVHQRALLADFGLVQSLVTMEGRTATGVVMGTVDYIAPEQGRGLPVDSRCDLYAVGVLAFQMLSGHLPYSADSPTALIFQHVYEPAPPLTDVPPALAAVVAKLMAKSREARHASAEAVIADLQAIRAGCPLPSKADLELAANPRIFLQAASAGADPMTSTPIIRVPQFPDESPFLEKAWLPDEQPSESGWWSRLQTLWKDWLQSRAPEWIQQLQSTQQQVGGAVAEYERRRDQLLSLVREAEDVLTILRSALSTRPDDAELPRAAADQEEQLGEMRLRLSQVEATLTRLCHQRDLLQARLKAAQAKLHLAGKPRPSKIRRRLALAVVIAPCVIAALFFVLPPWHWMGHSGGGNPVAAVPDLPLVTEILKDPAVTTDLSIRLQSISFGSADGLLGVVKADSSIELRDGKTGHVLNLIKTGASDPSQVMIDHDGNHAASLVQNGPVVSLSIWNTRQGSQTVVSADFPGAVRLLGFAGAPPHLMLAQQIDANQSVLTRWPLDGKPPVRLTVKANLDGPVAFDSTGRRFAITRPGRVLLGEIPADEKSPPTLGAIAEQVTAVVFHPHDGTVIIGSEKGFITVWDFTLRQPIRQLLGPSTRISALEIDDTGRWLAATDGEQVRIWDLGLMYVRAIIPVSKVTGLAYSPRGKELALVTDSSQVQLWSTDFPVMEIRFGVWLDRLSEEKRDQIRQPYASALQAYNPREATTRDGRLTAAAPRDTIPFVKDAKSGKQLYQFEGARPALGITISHDDQRVVIGSYDSQSGTGDVRMWNLQTGRPLGRFDGHIHYAWSVAFSNDDTLLLTGGKGAMHLWDVRTQTEVRRFKAPFPFVRRVAFSQDGRRATASIDDTPIKQHALFDVATGEALLLFSGMPPEFVFGPAAVYADQRFGTVREMAPAVKREQHAAPVSEPAKTNPQLPVATVEPVKPVVKVQPGGLGMRAIVHPIQSQGMMLPLSLTTFVVIRTELGITDEQKTTLAKLRGEAWDDYVTWVGTFDDFPSDATEAKRNAMRAVAAAKQAESAEKVREKYQPKLAEILDAKQIERLEQIALQAAGEHALSHPLVAKALKLSLMQRIQVVWIHKEFRDNAAKLKGRHFDKMGAIHELNQIRLKKLDAVLTDEQTEQFEKMKGEEFDLRSLWLSKQ